MMVSGVYTITNLESGKVYIGSTIDFERRWKEHRGELDKSIHWNPHLQCSWNKYGESAFEFEALECIDNPDELAKAEQFWLDLYRIEGRDLYNVAIVVDSPMRGRRHPKESRQRMSKSARNRPPISEETRRRKSEVMRGNQHGLGYKHTKEARHRMSEAAIGNQNALGHRHSEETKFKISETQKLRYFNSPVSKETRHRMSESARNKPPASEETRRRMSDSAKVRWARISYVLDCT